MTSSLANVASFVLISTSHFLVMTGAGLGGGLAAAQEATGSKTPSEAIQKIDPVQLQRIEALQQQRLEGLAPTPRVAPQAGSDPAESATESPDARSAASAVANKNWYPTVLSGQQFALQGNVQLADEHFRNALTLATTPSLRSQTYLSWADSYNQVSRENKDASDTLARSAELYRAALPDLSGNLRLVGYNNYASVLLRQERSDEALKALRQIEPQMATADAPSRARYLYNVGRALEAEGQGEPALDSYREAFATDTGYEPAARAAMRLHLSQKPDPLTVAGLATWLEDLIALRKTELAADGLHQTLAKAEWVSASDSSRFLQTALHLLALEGGDWDAYRKNWEQSLESAAHQGMPSGSYVIHEIERTYTADLPIRFVAPDEGVAPALFGEVPDPELRGAAAAFVKRVGDDFYARDKPSMALQRYSAAWSLDYQNVESALAAAALLLDMGSNLDPSLDHLNEFIYALFEAKGEAYLGQDWEAILRFHTVLGNIYERLEVWGPRGNPRSALFQWSNALAAHEKVKRISSERAPYAPVLRAKLARAQEAVSDIAAAWQSYVAAGEDALKLRNIELVREYVEAADRLTTRAQPSSSDLQRLAELRRYL